MTSTRRKWLSVLALMPLSCIGAEEFSYEFGGHTKGRILGQAFPSDSEFHALSGSTAFDIEGDLRLNVEADRGPWGFNAAYQLFAGYGDRIEFTRMLPPGASERFEIFPNDDRRLFDLDVPFVHIREDVGEIDVLFRFLLRDRFQRGTDAKSRHQHELDAPHAQTLADLVDQENVVRARGPNHRPGPFHPQREHGVLLAEINRQPL